MALSRDEPLRAALCLRAVPGTHRKSGPTVFPRVAKPLVTTAVTLMKRDETWL